MAISGTVAVEEKMVRLATELPLAAMFFKTAIESRIRQEVGALLGPTSTDDTARRGTDRS